MLAVGIVGKEKAVVMGSFLVLCVIVCSLQAASGTNSGFPYNWTRLYNGTQIDPSTMQLIWSDEFDNASVITLDSGSGPWYAPGHADYGMSHFPNPPNAVYNISNSILTQYTTNDTGKWLGACMQTMNSKGKGFACQNCYFEARARMNGGHGSWGAFWLHSTDYSVGNTTTIHSEIDVLEYYGPSDELGHHHTVHIWNTTNGTQHDYFNSDYNKVAPLDQAYHIHGCLLTDDWVIIYLDRAELARVQRPTQNKVPHYIIISVTMNSGDAPYVPSNMTFDYVRVYQNVTSTPSPTSSSTSSKTTTATSSAGGSSGGGTTNAANPAASTTNNLPSSTTTSGAMLLTVNVFALASAVLCCAVILW